MDVSPWDDVLHTFMIPIPSWPLTFMSNLEVLTCLHVPAVTSFAVTLTYHIWHMSLSPIDDVSRTFIWRCPLTSRSIYMFFVIVLCSGHICFVLWHSYTIFGTWVFHHGTMCHIHSWHLYDLDLWPSYQNYIITWYLNEKVTWMPFFVWRLTISFIIIHDGI